MTQFIPISEHLLERVFCALDSGSASSYYVATMRNETEDGPSRRSVALIEKVKAELEKARDQAQPGAILAAAAKGVDGLPPDCPVVPLGTANGVYFFRDTTGQLRALKACEFGPSALTSLFHGRAPFLYSTWPRRNSFGEVTGWKAEKAAEDLMAACAGKGIWKATGPDAPAGGTCADEARSTEALFKIGDQVRLKSERRFMTIAMLDCVDATCQWFDGASLEEADFHRDMLTAEPYPDHVPF